MVSPKTCPWSVCRDPLSQQGHGHRSRRRGVVVPLQPTTGISLYALASASVSPQGSKLRWVKTGQVCVPRSGSPVRPRASTRGFSFGGMPGNQTSLQQKHPYLQLFPGWLSPFPSPGQASVAGGGCPEH